jgi:hypothetical protein
LGIKQAPKPFHLSPFHPSSHMARLLLPLGLQLARPQEQEQEQEQDWA